MYYFIPSWYSKHKEFYENMVPWYWYDNRVNLDDLASLFRLFTQSNKDSELLILGYMPNLRYYLHEFDLFEQNYVSLFDKLQNIKNPNPKILNFKNLAWPEEADFIYTPFLILVQIKGERFAEIQFGNDGQIIWIDYFYETKINRRCIMDDRGFLSSVLYFSEDGNELYQDYLSIDGVWQFRNYFNKKSAILINPEVSKRFKFSTYNSLKELMEEYLENFFKEYINENDTIIFSYSNNHNDMIIKYVSRQNIIISFFQEHIEKSVNLEKMLKKCNLALTDSVVYFNYLKSLSLCPVTNLLPYEARLSLGKSQQIKELIVYLLIDKLSNEELEEIITITFDVMLKNNNINLILGSYRVDEPVRTEMQHKFETIKKKWLMLNEQTQVNDIENVYELEMQDVTGDVGFESNRDERVQFKVFSDKNSFLKQLEKVRLIVDLSKDPDLQTQISAISAGIPQINKVCTDYVEHLKNGYVVHDLADLKNAYDFYLFSLRNWNKALVFAVSKIGEYTSGLVVEKIISLMRETTDEK